MWIIGDWLSWRISVCFPNISPFNCSHSCEPCVQWLHLYDKHRVYHKYALSMTLQIILTHPSSCEFLWLFLLKKITWEGEMFNFSWTWHMQEKRKNESCRGIRKGICLLLCVEIESRHYTELAGKKVHWPAIYLSLPYCFISQKFPLKKYVCLFFSFFPQIFQLILLGNSQGGTGVWGVATMPT